MDESFDSSDSASWQVSTSGNWDWADQDNPTDSPSLGGYMSHVDVPGEGLHFVELDLTDSNVANYMNSYLVFWHNDPSSSFQSEMKFEVSYDNGATWLEAMTGHGSAHSIRHQERTVLEVFNVSGLLQGRGTPRLRVGYRKECPDEPSECSQVSEWVRWEVDDIRLVAWTSADDIVPGRVDSSINLYNPTDEAHGNRSRSFPPARGRGDLPVLRWAWA